jgi:Ser/Thr protein kinase RdoA (MazF antagonist)
VPELTPILERLERALGPITAGPVPLEGGITNRNYRVSFGERDCVVRLPGRDTSLLGISRDAERLAARAASSLGIAPAIVAADDECVVTEYVASKPLGPARLRASPEPVAAALRCFHECGVELPVRFWVPDLLEDYAATVRARGGILPGAYARTITLAGRIAEVLPLSAPVCCHDDLLPANVLSADSGGGVMLVDWEYAGMGHRLFDLGNLAVNSEFDEDAEKRLLSAYFGEPPGAGRHAALRLMRIMSDAREAAWGVVQGVVSELDFDFESYATSHFERLEREAKGDRLQEWLDAVATGAGAV